MTAFCICCRSWVRHDQLAYAVGAGRGYCAACLPELREMLGCRVCYRLHRRTGSVRVVGDQGTCADCRAAESGAC